jgi:5-methylcytosine-specific restriction endonuclease McrA
MTYKARRRAQEAGGDSTAAVAAWVAAAPKVCHWCGIPCTAGYHVDHYVPLSKGGKHAVSNLVIACGPCNLRKNAKCPYEFARTFGRLF